MQPQARHIAPLIVVALVSAGVGGWVAIAAFDSRMQVLAADMAQIVSRKLDPGATASGRKHRLDRGRQFRVDQDLTAKTR